MSIHSCFPNGLYTINNTIKSAWCKCEWRGLIGLYRVDLQIQNFTILGSKLGHSYENICPERRLINVRIYKTC